MLTLIIAEEEVFDQEKSEFLTLEPITLQLEHSLVSVSKWESKFEKPFLSKEDKTAEEVLWYVEAMVLTPDFPRDALLRISSANIDTINQYIQAKNTATTFGDLPDQKGRGRPEVITSELIYYWLTTFNIPFEAETWHLNRLFALIRICNIKNSKPKKMSRSEIARRNKELNDQRRAKLGTSG